MSVAISIIIPAFNEERYLPATLDHLRRAIAHPDLGSSHRIEVIVVDNASTDRTTAIAREADARVVVVPERNIALVRNAGARVALGDLLVFIDADTLVPPEVLSRITTLMSEPTCLGGAVDVDHRPTRRLVRWYLLGWRLVGRCLGMAQGATQFCRAEAFASLGGYDESTFMGEDVDFVWRLQRLARSRGGSIQTVRDIRVVPSSRRFDQWPIRRILTETNPLYITLFRRRRAAWGGWYNDAPR